MLTRTSLVLLTLATMGYFIGASDAASIFWRIESHLKDKDFRDVEGNTQLLVKWLDGKRGGWKIAAWMDKDMVQTLDSLTAMTRFKNEELCSVEVYRVIKKNNEELGRFLGEYQMETSPESRQGRLTCVENIVYRQLRQHAEVCMPQYPTIFEAKQAKLGPELIEKVRAMFEHIHQEFDKNIKKDEFTPANFYYDALLRQKEELTPNDAFLVYKGMKPFASDELSKSLKNFGETRAVVNKHLVEPCKEYVNNLFDVFEPATFDSFALRPDDMDGNEGREKYYTAWFDYTLCRAIVYEEQTEFVESIVRMAAIGA